MSRAPLLVNITCSRTRGPTVARFEWDGHSYVLIGSSKQRPGSVLPPSKESVKGSFSMSPKFTGCPHCGARDFVECGRCKLLGCYDETWPEFNCPSCGNHGPITGTIDRLSGLGGG